MSGDFAFSFTSYYHTTGPEEVAALYADFQQGVPACRRLQTARVDIPFPNLDQLAADLLAIGLRNRKAYRSVQASRLGGGCGGPVAEVLIVVEGLGASVANVPHPRAITISSKGTTPKGMAPARSSRCGQCRCD